jgi:hypothetical protein
MLLEVRIEQSFRNTTARPLSISPAFSLPAQAVLLGLDVVMGGRHLRSQVADKHTASFQREPTSAAHASADDTDVLLESNHDGSQTLHLGDLGPGEICLITVRYGQTPRYERGELHLNIPATINPYRSSAVRAAVKTEEIFDLAINIYGDWAQAHISSPTHPMTFLARGSEDEGSMAQSVRVSLTRRSTPERDVILILSDLAQESLSMAWCEYDPIKTDQVVALLAFQPDLPARQDPMALKILVDCSSAMSSEDIRTARRLQQSLVAQLQAEDQFSLSRFGSQVQHRPLWYANEACKLAARHAAQDLSARMGNPCLHAALQSTLDQTVEQACDVVLITQAQVSDIDATLLVAKHSKQRIFILCLGTGSTHAHALLRQVAEVSGGLFELVPSGQTPEVIESVEAILNRLLHRLRSEQRFGLALQWPENIEPIWQSPMPHSIFDGDTVLVHAILKKRPQGHVRLLGYSKKAKQDDRRPLWQRLLAFIRRPSYSALGLTQHTHSNRWQESLHTIATLYTVSSEDIPSPLPVRPTATELARMVAACRYQEQPQPWLAVQYQLTTRSTLLILVHPHEDAHQALDRPPAFKLRQKRPPPLRPLSQPVGRQEPVFAVLKRPASPVPPITTTRPLSPWEFSRVFEQRQPNDWPTTLQGLRDMGLGKGVITWLVCHLSEGPAGDIDVAAGIHAFLTFFAHPLTRQALHQGHAIPAAHPLRQHPDPRLARMSHDFSSMTGENWPAL